MIKFSQIEHFVSMQYSTNHNCRNSYYHAYTDRLIDIYALLCSVVVIIAAQLHSTKPELKFCARSNPAGGLSEIRDGEDL